MKKRLTALLLIVTFLIAFFPMLGLQSKQAKAANAIVDTNLTIVLGDDGSNLYKVFMEEGNLKVQAQYYYDSTATLSYHTEWLYFTAYDTGGNPTDASMYYTFDVPTERTPQVEGSVQYETFTIPATTIREWAESLTGLSANGKALTIYMSQGFALKSRSNKKDAWKIDSSPVYSTLEGIRGAANWSFETRMNFSAYYDVPLVLDLTTYNLTVGTKDSKAGFVSGSRTSIEAGTEVFPQAVANEGYYFTNWEVEKGGMDASVNLTEASLRFSMPSTDVTLLAHFEKKPEVTPTKPPVSTPTPKPTTKPGITATTTPSPVPTSTPIPTPHMPAPEDVKRVRKSHVRYYTTDAGYTMETIYHTGGDLAGRTSETSGGSLKSSTYTVLNASYQVGVDASGNTWYFTAEGTNAVHVHPKVYQGNDATTEQIRNITELTFPRTLIYNGAVYNVTGIGGGASRYKKTSTTTNGVFEPTQGKYSLYDYKESSSNNDTYMHTQEYRTDIRYAYGVVGTGFITSSSNRYFYWWRNGTETTEEEDYRNDYYVHNTTLKYVTIPDSVTTIENYAFYGCQALVKVIGGDKVTAIGTSAFEGADHLIAKACMNREELKEWTGYDGYVYYYYNGSYTFDVYTGVMQKWNDRIVLSEQLDLAPFTDLKTIGTTAFMWHTNLFDVVLPDGLGRIGTNAFAGCKLNRITIPGKNTIIEDGSGYADEDGHSYRFGTGKSSTLGTKGTKDTVIITVPESKAMTYGLTYNKYYTLRCGYEIVYHNNATPEELYATASMLKELNETAMQRVNLSQFAEAILDDDGDLFIRYRREGERAGQYAKNVKFKEIKTMSGKHWTGSEYVDCNWYFAVGTKGEVWCCTEYAPFTWTSISMPEGAFSYQFSGNGEDVWIYYISGNGQLCVAKITEDYSNAGGYGERLKLEGHEEISHDVGHQFDYILIENEGEVYPGATGSVFYAGQIFVNGISPQIIAHVAGDSPVDAMKLIQFQSTPFGYPLGSADTIAARYTDREPTVIASDVGDKTWIHKTDKNAIGNYKVSYLNMGGIVNTLECKAGNCEMIFSYDAGGNQRLLYADNEVSILGYEAVYDTEMQITAFHVYSHRKNEIVELLPTTDKKAPEIEKTWKVAFSYYDESNGNMDCYMLFFLGNGNLYCVSQVGNNTPRARLLVNDVAEVEDCMIPSAGDYGFLVLDNEGTVWSLGTHQKGALANIDSYYYAGDRKKMFELLYMPTKIRSSAAFTDICLTENYSLLQGNDGNLYAAGYGSEIFEDNNTHYAGFLKVSAVMELDTEDIFLYGYEFREVIYNSMFQREGYKFTEWNTRADGRGMVYRPGEELLLTAPVTVYAQWEEAQNIIRYAPNGGSGSMEDDVYKLDVTKVMLKENAYTKQGYEFIGWNTEADGSGISYQDGATITLSQGTTTVLHAQWEPFSYTVKIARDEIRVTPVIITDMFDLEYDEAMTVPTALADKCYKVEYDLNRRSTMSTVPCWKTETPLSELYTKALLTFLGWQVYEETEDGYAYRGFYTPGDKMKNLAEQKGNALVLFPYWGGEASYVKLPTAVSVGYDFVGWTVDKSETKEENVIHAEEGSGAQYKPTGNETLYAYYVPKEYEVELVADIKGAKPEEITETQTSVTMGFDQRVPNVKVPESKHYFFLGYFTEPKGEGEQYYDENGVGLKRWQVADGSVTTLYAHMIAEVEVTLDGRGATTQEQTLVTMTYGEVGPDVLLPEKTGYTFDGYYTELRGGGTQYFDEKGKGTKVWLESDVKILYACWTQNPLELPEKEEMETPEVLPEQQVRLEVIPENNRIDFWTEEYDVTEGIPSTKSVNLRASCGAFLLSCLFERRSGIEMIRANVTVQYRTQYEDAENEMLVISESQTKTVEVMVPRMWSYWMVKEGGVYVPEKLRVKNDCLETGIVEVPICWETDGAARQASYRLITYDEEERILWPSYDTDGIPLLTLFLEEEQYIISDIPGELPEVEDYLQTVCWNAAWKNQTQFTVRSDLFCVEGISLLSDHEKEDGQGEEPWYEAVGHIKEILWETDVSQAEKKEIPLLGTVENGRYDTMGEVVYLAEKGVVGEETEKRVPVKEKNEVFVHTPVLCAVELTAEHETQYQCETVPEGREVLVLDETGEYSDFTLRISNQGYHSNKTGYGLRNYTEYVAKKNGKVQNEVRFPFAVWVDVGNDKKSENDILLEADIWYTIGTQDQRFYMPFWISEGSYEFEARTVACNGEGKEGAAELLRNQNSECYVANAEIKVYLTGRLYDFTVFEVFGNTAWEEVQSEELKYTVGPVTEGQSDAFDTLLLRKGGHPTYRNMGGLPMAGGFGFWLKSVGSFFSEETTITIVPELVCLCENEYRAVDLYYEKETEKGVYLTKWSAAEFEITLRAAEDSKADRACLEKLTAVAGKDTVLQYGEEIGDAVRYWYGSFTLPDVLYAAEKGTDVFEYQRGYGLSFTEDFWLLDDILVLRFSIRLDNKAGEVLYYGKIPETISNNIWCMEAGRNSCIDIEGTVYPIYGGEVAVLYPGEFGGNDYVVHGIY